MAESTTSPPSSSAAIARNRRARSIRACAGAQSAFSGTAMSITRNASSQVEGPARASTTTLATSASPAIASVLAATKVNVSS